MFYGKLPLFPCPLLPSRKGVLFPGVPLTGTVAPGPHAQLIVDAMSEQGLLGVFAVRQRRRIYACSTCDEVFIDAHSLARHQRKVHGLNPVPEVEPSASRPGPGPLAPSSPAALPGSLCLARLRRAQPLPDGGFIVRILGLERARVQRELSTNRPYPVVEARSMSSPRPFPPSHSGAMARARQVIEALRGNPHPTSSQTWLGDPYPPGRWLDLLCQVLPVSWEDQLQLLDEACHQSRYERVTEHLRDQSEWLNSLPQHLISALLPPHSGPN